MIVIPCRICYTVPAVEPFDRRGVNAVLLILVLTFLGTVAANVVSHLICKWLDSRRDGSA